MADVDNRNRNRRSNRTGQPNPKREARAKARRAPYGGCVRSVRQGYRALACRRARVRWYACRICRGDEGQAQAPTLSRNRLPRSLRSPRSRPRLAAEPAPAEEAAEIESAPAAEKPAGPCPRSLCSTPLPRRPFWTTVEATRSSVTWPCSPLPRSPTRAVAIFRAIWARRPRLCADSYLYNVLDSSANGTVRTVAATSTASFTANRALVVPVVRFDRNHMHAYADVIVAAAPNAKARSPGVSRG